MSFLSSVECGKFNLKKPFQSGKILACTKKSEICATSTLNTRTHNRGQNDPKSGSQMDFSKHGGDIFLVFFDFVSNLCQRMMVVQLFR